MRSDGAQVCETYSKFPLTTTRTPLSKGRVYHYTRVAEIHSRFLYVEDGHPTPLPILRRKFIHDVHNFWCREMKNETYRKYRPEEGVYEQETNQRA